MFLLDCFNPFTTLQIYELNDMKKNLTILIVSLGI